nr:immunoglobulin heavy chain junction region [Macaca mulatta]
CATIFGLARHDYW